jgi:hypothetical protein
LDDVLKRLHTVKQTVSEIRANVAGLTAVVPHLATKADIAEVKTAVSSVESSRIKRIVGTLLAVTIVAFTIARYVAPA